MAEVPLHHTREYVRSILLGAFLASMMVIVLHYSETHFVIAEGGHWRF
jgi:hypothetical protein